MADDSDNDDLVGPALPPHLMQRRQQQQSNLQQSVEIGPSVTNKPGEQPQKETEHNDSKKGKPKKRRTVMGPAAPPPPEQAAARVYDDDDDDFGPMPPPAGADNVDHEAEWQERLNEIAARAERTQNETTRKNVSEKAKGREMWMLVPPEPSRLNLGQDSLKSRQFSKTSKSLTIDQSGWTALPGEGGNSEANTRKRKPEVDVPRPLTSEELATQEFIKSHNAKERPKSLMEIHSEQYVKTKKYEQDDLANRPFDRDRDVVSRRMDEKSRRSAIESAKGLDTKFSHGSRTFL